MFVLWYRPLFDGLVGMVLLQELRRRDEIQVQRRKVQTALLVASWTRHQTQLAKVDACVTQTEPALYFVPAK